MSLKANQERTFAIVIDRHAHQGAHDMRPGRTIMSALADETLWRNHCEQNFIPTCGG